MAKKKAEKKVVKAKPEPLPTKRYRCTGCNLEYDKVNSGTGPTDCPTCAKIGMRIG